MTTDQPDADLTPTLLALHRIAVAVSLPDDERPERTWGAAA